MAEVQAPGSGNIWSEVLRAFSGDPVSKQTEENLRKIGLVRSQTQLRDAERALNQPEKSSDEILAGALDAREKNQKLDLENTTRTLREVVGVPNLVALGETVSGIRQSEAEKRSQLEQSDRSAYVGDISRLQGQQQNHELAYGRQVQEGTTQTLAQLIDATRGDQAFYERMTKPNVVRDLLTSLGDTAMRLGALKIAGLG